MSCLICFLFRQRNERLKEKFPPRQGIEPTNEDTYGTRGGGGGAGNSYVCCRIFSLLLRGLPILYVGVSTGNEFHS